MIEDRETGRSRGFGFIDMSTKEEGAAAIEKFNGQELGGRAVESQRSQAARKSRRLLVKSTIARSEGISGFQKTRDLFHYEMSVRVVWQVQGLLNEG